MASARYSGEVERKWTTRKKEEEGRKDEGRETVHSLILAEGGFVPVVIPKSSVFVLDRERR